MTSIGRLLNFNLKIQANQSDFVGEFQTSCDVQCLHRARASDNLCLQLLSSDMYLEILIRAIVEHYELQNWVKQLIDQATASGQCNADPY